MCIDRDASFCQHTSLLHVIDARTFETEEIVRLPNFDSPSLYQPHPSTRPRSTSPLRSSAARSSPSSSDPLAPPRIVLFSGALEDTFRIPSSDSSSTWRSSRRARRLASRDDLSPDEDPESILVIPPLGDREVENDVRRLLGRHGLRRTAVLDPETDPREPLESATSVSASASASEGTRDREGDEMDVDELESDCVSSHAPSRAGSPAPASQMALQSSGARPLELLRSRPTLLARRESSGPYAVASRWGVGSSSVGAAAVAASAAAARRHHRRGTGQGREMRGEEGEEEQDIAGMCFDPTGTFVYVASVKGVAEWRVRGAEQRWWTEPQWA